MQISLNDLRFKLRMVGCRLSFFSLLGVVERAKLKGLPSQHFDGMEMQPFPFFLSLFRRQYMARGRDNKWGPIDAYAASFPLK